MPRFEPHPARRPAVVTGASAGIGAAIVRRLVSEGVPVVLGARRVERCQRLLDALAAEFERTPEALVLPLDVTALDSIAAFAEAATAWAGEIDIVISNAGGLDPLPAWGSPEGFGGQISLNLLGPQALCAQLCPAMIARQRGDLVFVTSETAVFTRPLAAGYVAAKAGLEAWVRTLRLELEGTGVRAGMVRPGPTVTEQGGDWDGVDIEHVVRTWERLALIRHDGYMRPDDVATAVWAMVTTPRGAEIALIEAQPQAPVGPRTVADRPAAPSGEGD